MFCQLLVRTLLSSCFGGKLADEMETGVMYAGYALYS